MNIIDLFKALGFYDNKPQLTRFYLRYEGIGGLKTDLIYIKDNKIWHEGERGSGILFYMDVDNESFMNIAEKQSRKRSNYFFNNIWPEEGGVGTIDQQETIIQNFERRW